MITAIALTGNDQAVSATPASYRGITLRETASAVATIRVYDGLTATGTLLDTVALAANASVSLVYPEAIFAAKGIFVSKVAGTVEGSIRIG